MLDIKFIRENSDLIKEAARKKHSDFNVEELVKVDDERKRLSGEVDGLRAKQNGFSQKVAQVADPGEKAKMISELKAFKEKLQEKENELKEIMQAWQQLMVRVPNIPDMSVPEGKDEADNKELKQGGEKPKFSFEPKNHVDLMVNKGWADFERGNKVHGFRGYFLKNAMAELSFAIWNYARDFYLKKNFEFVLAPAIVKKEYLYGTGHLPSDAEDLYVTQDEDYLSGTGEVPMMAYHADETLKKEELPRRYLAFTPCYRREVGSYGKDTKGLLRVHEFYKLEQLVLCEADHQTSVAVHEELQENFEAFVESLGLHYRRVVLCTGETKLGQVKCYDTELWVPSQEMYREIASASYYHDFQTRRFNIRYDDTGTKRYAHSLNATAAPTPRLLIALIEQNQQTDGSIAVPAALRPYLGGRETLG